MTNSNNFGGKRKGAGAPLGTLKTLMLENGTPQMIVDQLKTKLENKEIDVKDLISLLGYFIHKLKAIEVNEIKEEPQSVDASRLWLNSLEDE